MRTPRHREVNSYLLQVCCCGEEPTSSRRSIEREEDPPKCGKASNVALVSTEWQRSQAQQQ